ncbi:hypothetical protein BOTBODRAFT_103181 [Botryobasidium botryosum FD-172 SS1]|uniref:Amino acid permease/ SLC12A domain-containing protein n=1 Tax=Botryobasidium botryosum (strain FD-172 SS1) TaxID=930990 RepID=A0A067N4M7_BOTB1|nr:hypothetical protein BOTBODRAFT_103181 [Botryobasidium botryosum FD-172 SS1]
MSVQKPFDERSLEKGSEKGRLPSDTIVEAAHPADDRFHFDERDLDQVQRRLKQRHVQMIAIAGTIGTGLFLGSGKALQRAGPLGALLAYIFIGSIAYATLCSVGEMTSFAPISGSFPHYAARWVDPALGFALGWNYFYTQAMTIPVEVTAAQIILTFWDDNPQHVAIYTAVISVCICLINLFGVRWFGESEFFFSFIKLALISLLIITGLVIDLGGGPDHDRIGFRYWKNPGALNTFLVDSPKSTGRFLALIGVLIQAAFSFQGMELVAIAASETENPRRNIAKAVRRVFYRILFFYILGILITGMVIPYNDPALLSDSNNAAQSPYVIAMTRAGIKGLPHVVNAGVFTSAFSAGNSFLFCASRVLYGLALRGQAPSIFARCTKAGLPWISVLFCSSFAFLSFMNVNSGSANVFNWFVNLTTVGGLIAWCGINSAYLGFWRGLRAQGYDRKTFIYYSSLQPYLSIWGIFWTSLIVLINGFDVFFDFTAAGFLTAYLNIPLFVILLFGWKFWKRTKMWHPTQMDFTTGIPSVEETESPEIPPTTIKGKIFEAIF